MATIPTVPTEVPGNFWTAALWNANILGGIGYLLAPVRFKGYSSVAQSIATGATLIPLTLDTELYDSDGGHSTTTNTSRYTVQTAGLYRVTGSACFATNTTGTRTVGVMLNGAQVVGSMIQSAPPANGASVLTTTDVQCAVGDYMEIGAWQNSGGPLATATNSAGIYTAMCLHRISA